MKYLFVLLFSAIVLTGCGEQNSDTAEKQDNKFLVDTTGLKTEPAANPNESFQMLYKFEQGKPYNYRISMVSDVDQQTIMDTTINMKVHQSMVYLFSLTPKETDGDGVTELSCVINSAKIEMEGSGRKVKYESDSIKTADDKNKFAEHHSLINNPFSLRVSKSGELLEVYKADKIANSYLEYRNLKDSASAEQKTGLKNQIVETMLKPLLGAIFVKVPEKSMAKDSVWEKKQPSQQMMVFQVAQTNRYKVEGLEKLNNDKLAVVDLITESDISGNLKHSEQGVNYSFTKPKFTAQGTMYFNIDKGYVQKVKSETMLETSVTAEASTPAGMQRRSNKERVKTTNIVEKL